MIAPLKVLRKGSAERYLAQFQSSMEGQEPYMELWQEARKQETAASAVAG